jgi:hypothetical protein
MQHSTMIRPFTVAIIRKTFCTRRHNKQSMLLVTKQYQAEMMNFIFVDYFSSNTQWQRLICYDCSQISATTKQKSGKLHSRWIEGVCVCVWWWRFALLLLLLLLLVKLCGAAFYDSYLVDPASSHMLVSKIKPCMSKYKRYTVKLRLAH